jgi:transcription elongation factor GreA
MGKIQYVSAERLEELKRELKHLKMVERRAVAERIESAKALGDLSENAEYHDAKDEMAQLEGRVFEIEDLIKNAQIIEEGKGSSGAIRVGSTVEVEVGGKVKTFMLVGSNEADPAGGKISNESPIGSALLGASMGQAVEVKTPAGVTVYRIKDVR